MYKHTRYIYSNGRPVSVTIRPYKETDFPALIDLQAACFPPPFPAELWWNQEQLTNHVTLFPEGALCVEVEGKIVGSITSLLTTMPTEQHCSWTEATDDGYIRNHNPHGDTLYIVDISVRPAYRKLGLGKLLMEAMYHLVIEKKLARVLGGGRIPGYHQYAGQLTAEEYVERLIVGEINDPVVSFLLRCGRTPVAVVANYLADVESQNYGVLMEWRNPFLEVTNGIHSH